MSARAVLSRAARGAIWRVAARLDRGERVTCPVCQSGLQAFLPFGVGWRVRCGALCPCCRSLERDRAAWLELTVFPKYLESTNRLLHIAPERCLEPQLRQRVRSSYVTADLMRTDVDQRVSVEELPFDNHTFDAVICNHVLEHVPNDRKAMTELHRVLAPGGWALLQVPLDGEAAMTVEDPSIASPRERRRRFGQHDHVRLYGRDYVDRLRDAGFQPQLRVIRDCYAEQDIKRFGLDRRETLHFCRA